MARTPTSSGHAHKRTRTAPRHMRPRSHLVVLVVLALFATVLAVTAAPTALASPTPVLGLDLPSLKLTATSPPVTTADVIPPDWSNQDVEVGLSASPTASGADIQSIWYRVDSGTPVTVDSDYADVLVPAKADHSNDGKHTITFHATDTLGAVEADKTCTAEIDTTAPSGSFKLGDGSGTTTTRKVKVGLSTLKDLSGVDAGSAAFSVDNQQTWNSLNYDGTLTLPAALGPVTVWGDILDLAGNEVILKQTITRAPNTTPPTVTVSGVDLAWHTSAVTITIEASVADDGGLASITYAVDGKAGTTVSADPSLSYETVKVTIPAPTDGSNNGVHTIAFSAKNADGYSSATQTVKVNIGPPPPGITYWKEQAPAGTPGLNDVAFVSATKGWAVGDKGMILATTDGGAHWLKQVSGTAASLKYVAFGDASHGYAITSKGSVLATANGGASWTAHSLGSLFAAGTDIVEGLAANGTSHVWVLLDEDVNKPVHILASASGGASWAQQPTGGLTGYARGIDFVDQNDGWAFVGTFTSGVPVGVVLHTTSGGSSWTSKSLGVMTKPWDVFALDLKHVWLAGYENSLTIRTSDGSTWGSYKSAAELTALGFSDPLNGWATAFGALLQSSDGGATWKPSLIDSNVFFGGIAAADANHVWAVGNTPIYDADYNLIGSTGTIQSLIVPIIVTAPTTTSVWPSGSTQTISWTLTRAFSNGEFRVGLLNAAGTSVLSKQVLPTAGKTSYAHSFAASVPAASGYKAYVYWRPTVGTGNWTATAKSAAFTVTPIDITAPTATSSWPSGSTQSVTWTVSPAYPATGEFRVGLVNSAGTVLINKQVLPVAAKTSYTLSLAASVPAASGYKAYVYWRPTVGTGAWTATAKSAAFTVTPIDITSPLATSSWKTGTTHSVTWTVNPAYAAVGEFRVGLLSAAGTVLINKQVKPTAGKTSYALSFTVSVPAASGYRAFVSYRPTVGSGAYTATARSAAFTVTP